MQFIPFLALLFFIVRPLTILFHEFGHAIPALLFTKKKVTINLGDYEPEKKKLKLTLGRLTIQLRYNPFMWNGGLCIHSTEGLTTTQLILITLSGAVFSFFVAALCCYLAFFTDAHGLLKLSCVMLLFSATFDLFSNLAPDKEHILLENGETLQNDGANLKHLWKIKRIEPPFNQGIALYNEKKYAEAAEKFRLIVNKGFDGDDLYRLLIHSLMNNNQYKEAYEYDKHFMEHGELTSEDYGNSALIKSRNHLYEESIIDYSKSIELNPENVISLNNRGYTLNLLEQYEIAISDFDKTIELDPGFSYAYNNRGLSKIKLGQEKEGLADIYRAKHLDDANSYVYLHLGIYHFDKGEYKKAQEQFEQAEKLDPTTHGLRNYIELTKEKLNQK